MFAAKRLGKVQSASRVSVQYMLTCLTGTTESQTEIAPRHHTDKGGRLPGMADGYRSP